MHVRLPYIHKPLPLQGDTPDFPVMKYFSSLHVQATTRTSQESRGNWLACRANAGSVSTDAIHGRRMVTLLLHRHT